MSRAETQKRRLEIYRLHLAGLSEEAIAGHVGIDKSSVSRHLKYMRDHNSWVGRSQRDLYREITREVYDAARQTREEAVKILVDPMNQKRPEVKLGAVSRVQAAIGLLADLRPDLGTLAAWEELEELRNAMTEKRMADRVLPNGRRVPVESAAL